MILDNANIILHHANSSQGSRGRHAIDKGEGCQGEGSEEEKDRSGRREAKAWIKRQRQSPLYSCLELQVCSRQSTQLGSITEG